MASLSLDRSSAADRLARGLLAIGIAFLALTADRAVAQAPDDPYYQVLYEFTGGADGALPQANLIADSAGNLYGTTTSGGTISNTCPFPPSACGVVFKLDPQGQETTLYTFTGGADGAAPFSGLVRDSAGNLYGTTTSGGFKGSACPFASSGGCGVVFKLDPQGNQTVLHTFGMFSGDGATPLAGLIQDSAGRLYGTTAYGGNTKSPCSYPVYDCGVIFRLDSSGQNYRVLYRFTGGPDGGNPYAGLIRDSSGNLYGTTYYGGATSSPCPFTGSGCGVVFKLDTRGNETVLHAFAGSDGALPVAGLIRDSAGSLYGTTGFGGNTSSSCPYGLDGCGVVFKVDPLGTETVMYAFTGGADGANPVAPVLRDLGGNLWGTTRLGGSTGVLCSNPFGCGVVFRVDPLGKEAPGHTFTGGSDGANPVGGMLQYDGYIYLMVQRGGTGNAGVVLKVDGTGG